METRKKIKSSPADKVFTVCNTIFMILFILITLYPILNTLALAFNDGTDALRGGIYLIPRKWTLKNFITVFTERKSDHRCLYYCGTNTDRNVYSTYC